MRITIFDGLRGYFLIMMMLSHINILFDANFVRIIHFASYSWIDAAFGFVFVSGITVGLVYGRRLIRDGFPAARSALWRRFFEIYRYHAFLVIFLLFLAFFLQALDILPEHLAPYIERPLLQTISSLLGFSGTIFNIILPMYLFFIAFTPLVLRLFSTGAYAPTILSLVSIWIIAQSGSIDAVQLLLKEVTGFQRIGIFFNIFAWQLLYFSGVLIGFLLAKDALDISFLYESQWKSAFFVGAAMSVFLALFARYNYSVREIIFHGEAINHPIWLSKQSMSTMHVFSFFLYLFLFVWLLSAGRGCGISLIEKLSFLINWVFTRKLFTYLGMHSLQVFAMHVVICYLAITLTEVWKPEGFLSSIFIILSLVPLYLAAWLHERRFIP